MSRSQEIADAYHAVTVLSQGEHRPHREPPNLLTRSRTVCIPAPHTGEVRPKREARLAPTQIVEGRQTSICSCYIYPPRILGQLNSRKETAAA